MSSDSSSSDSCASSNDRLNPMSSDMRALISMMGEGISPRIVLAHLAPSFPVPPNADDMALWRMIISLIEPPKRDKLLQYNTITDAIELINKSKKILVLSGAGISTSAGIPDFRSRNGIYVQIHAQYPDLRDPKSMFDIQYFRKNPHPFYQFARALYPGQYQPTIGHKFIKAIEDHDKLLRNYSQNIDTLEKQAGIKRVIECHGSFATASCTSCHFKVDGNDIRDEVLDRKVPKCPKCLASESGPEDHLGVMKPDIVFFGEQLGDEFHSSLERDKDEVDLLIVIGSSLKVRPVALIPKSIPANVPQILINKEPLDHINFDIELLGNCDEIIQELCYRLGGSWTEICLSDRSPLIEIAGLISSKIIESSNTVTANLTIEEKPESPIISSADSGIFPESSSGVQSNSSAMSASDQIPSVESASNPGEKNDEDHDDDDDDDAWDDVEILDDDDIPGVVLRAKADIDIPPSSYLFIEPNIYLFPGAEMSRSQYDCIKKLDSTTKRKEIPLNE